MQLKGFEASLELSRDIKTFKMLEVRIISRDVFEVIGNVSKPIVVYERRWRRGARGSLFTDQEPRGRIILLLRSPRLDACSTSSSVSYLALKPVPSARECATQG